MAEVQMETQQEKKPSGASRFFAIIAGIAGLYTFLQAGMRGHSAGWEELAMYAAPAVVCALISIAISRDHVKMSLTGAILGIVGMYLGA